MALIVFLLSFGLLIVVLIALAIGLTRLTVYCIRNVDKAMRGQRFQSVVDDVLNMALNGLSKVVAAALKSLKIKSGVVSTQTMSVCDLEVKTDWSLYDTPTFIRKGVVVVI